MKQTELKPLLDAAVRAAREAGALMRKNRHLRKKIADEQRHDIKLELDVLCQRVIERSLRSAFPAISILGEEGVSTHGEAPARWVVDPIDGTVNFAYGIPHACVSVALQTRQPAASLACIFHTPRGAHAPSRVPVGASPTGSASARATECFKPQVHACGEAPQAAREARALPRERCEIPALGPYETTLGVVYDPFCEEIWTAVRGGPARLNGRVIHVSGRRRLAETILSLGFAKHPETVNQMLPVFSQLVPHVRKVRMMGAAALALVYVACGRFDAYVERGIRLWDIAAGGLILECAGGEFWRRQTAGEHTYQIIASNGLLRRRLRARSPQLRKVFGAPSFRA